MTIAKRSQPLYKHLYVQVLFAIVVGVFVGFYFPHSATQLRPLGDAFIRLIKMMIGPVVFTTVTLGIAKMRDLKEVGRIGIKALVYFEVVSSLALVIGLIVVNVMKPGVGINADPSTIDTTSLNEYTNTVRSLSIVGLLMHMIPETIVGAFASGDVLQILVIALVFGTVLSQLKERAHGLIRLLEQFSEVLFAAIAWTMKFAPIGAFGAMAFTIGAYGVGTLVSLGKLMACVYGTCFLFVFLVLGAIARVTGFSLWKFLRYIREEILVVLGTSSSETALPRLIMKLEKLGCSESVVGLVVPTGFSFNLDGTSIYLTMAALFVAQATNTSLSLGDQLAILAVLMITSKGAAAVTGSGFVTLAATMSVMKDIPVAGLALLIGIDRFMSEARAITNLIGNGVATIVIAKWEKELDITQMKKELSSTS